MLIYNSKKEFIGIDEQDLDTLGFKTLSDLRAQAADFADLFVKTPGFIHNFKHVHWIDFITCADSTETPKVVIHANNKSYRCNINISTAYLTDDPSTKAFLVNLQNIRELTTNENSDIASDLLRKPSPEVAQPTSIPFTHEETPLRDEYNPETAIIEDSYDDAFIEEQIEVPQQIDSIVEKNPTMLDAPLDIDFEDEIISDIHEIEEVQEETLDAPSFDKEPEEEQFESNYVFNPQIASDELGLPIDLIEEFIEDFSAQAKEFKDDLYQSANDGDLDNVKILSHKLKGVAANLRIEDAYEVLTTINTSSDVNIIKKNLNHLYQIISKLSGEVIATPQAISEPSTVIEDVIEDDFVLDFKDTNVEEDIELQLDDEIVIEDSAVPEKIDIPELADDIFLDNQIADDKVIEEQSIALDMETVDMEELSKEVSQIDELPELIEIEDEKISIVDEPIIEEIKEIEEIQEIETTSNKIKVDYNKVDIANEIGLDADTFDELLQDYISHSKHICDSINNAIETNDSIGWQREAVKLKGMSDNMRVHDFTSDLETLLNTVDQEVATQALENVISVITQISNLEV